MTETAQEVSTQIRQEMVNNCLWGVEHRAQFYYTEQNRPLPLNVPKYCLPIATDCSGFATLMALWSGAGDPNGAGFKESGYTGYMLNACRHITAEEAQPGDLVVFANDHVVVLTSSGSNGPNAMCVSHGSPGDPIHVSLASEMQSHPGMALTYLLLPGGGTPPPPHTHGNPYVPLVVDGGFGPLTTKALQWVVKVAADGIFGPKTKRALQTHLGVTPDGNIGPITVRALQARVGATQDGQWGPQTTRDLQLSINEGRF